MIAYDFVEPKKTPEEAVKFLQEILFPLCQEFWETSGRKYFRADKWDIPMLEFIQMWSGGTLVVTAARNGEGRAQGFVIGGLVRPFFYKTTILQVEVWYGRTREVAEGLFAHLASIMKYFSAERITVPDFGAGIPKIDGFENVIELAGKTVAR
jgi:hypothetical protein